MKTLALRLFFLTFAFAFLSCSSDNAVDLFVEEEIILEEEMIPEEEGTPEVEVTPGVEETGPYKYSEIELKVLELINNHRKNTGLSALIKLDLISELADTHSNYMVKTGILSHDNFRDRALKLISKANATSVGENVAYGPKTAQDVVNGWLGSSGHKGVIEDSKFTHFGVSVETDSSGKNYYTQIFIAK